MEIEVTVHRDVSSHYRPHEVVGVVSATAEGKVRFRSINDTGEARVTIETNARAGRQAEDVKVLGFLREVIDFRVAGGAERTGQVNRQRCAIRREIKNLVVIVYGSG